MRNVFFLILVLFTSSTFSQRKNPSNLKHYTDTLIFSKIPINAATYSNQYLSPWIAEIIKDSASHRSIYFTNEFPINRKVQNHIELTCAEMDTHILNTYTGDLYLESFTSNFTYFNPTEDLIKTDNWAIPNSAMYFQNPAKVEVDLNQFQLTTSEAFSNNLNDYVQPFFFQNEEITNMQYRSFVQYVRDSIGRTLLSENLNIYDWKIPTYDSLGKEKYQEDWILNWETRIDWEKHVDNKQYEYLAELFLDESDRFYDRIEIDIRQLRYKYVDVEGDTITLNIYPDTLCWIHDFDESKLESNTSMYFWHPAYDNYPLVGVDWHQAKAFCAWMTKEANKYFQQVGVGYKIKYDLPSVIQWDFVRNKSMENQNMIFQPRFNWETNLILTEHQSIPLHLDEDTTYNYNDFLDFKGKLTRESTLNKPLSQLSYVSNYRELILNGSLPYLLNRPYIKTKRQKKYPIYKVANVKYMGSSVSEWLQESYQVNWKLMYYKRMELLIKSSGADTDIQALREEYFNAYNHPEGRMVIGANWYDYRDEYYEGKTFESMDAKVFADPNKGFATVGFRLIATFEPIED